MGNGKRSGARPRCCPATSRRIGRAEQGIEDRIVPPGWIGAEERMDRRVEVGAVGDLTDPLDLLAIGPDAGRLRPLLIARA